VQLRWEIIPQCTPFINVWNVGETGSGNNWNIGSGNCRKWICIFCVIEMSGSMLVSMPEVVQQAEMPSLTMYKKYQLT